MTPSGDPRAILVMVAVLVASGDARFETRLAAGFNRRNRMLEGAEAIWSAEVPSASMCLSACMKLRCQSLTYGLGRCEVFNTYLCHPEDRFHLSLVASPGVAYFDLHSDRSKVKITRKESCVLYGRCIEQCDEGDWTTTPDPTAEADADPDADDTTSSERSDFPADLRLADANASTTTAEPNLESTKVGQSAVDGTRAAGLSVHSQSSSQAASLDAKSNAKGSHKSFDRTGTADGTAGGGSSSRESGSSGGQGSSGDGASSQGRTSKSRTSPSVPGWKSEPGVVSTQVDKLDSGILLIQTPVRNFDDAQAECVRNNMSLAMPKNRQEHEMLVKAMKSRGIGRMWIGVRKVTMTGTDAIYVDGSAVLDTLLLWGDGQPNNSRGGQTCVEMNAVLKYLWNDYNCLHKSAFVCR